MRAEVRQDGSTGALGSTVVTAGGGPAAPFHDEIEFSTPTEPYGAMVFTVASARDGSTSQVAAYRIRFA